jgi:hypothetical protein
MSACAAFLPRPLNDFTMSGFNEFAVNVHPVPNPDGPARRAWSRNAGHAVVRVGSLGLQMWRRAFLPGHGDDEQHQGRE